MAEQQQQKVSFSATAPRFLWPTLMVMVATAVGLGGSRLAQGPTASVEASPAQPEIPTSIQRALDEQRTALEARSAKTLEDCVRQNGETKVELNRTLERLDKKLDKIDSSTEQLQIEVTALKTEMRLRRR